MIDGRDNSSARCLRIDERFNSIVDGGTLGSFSSCGLVLVVVCNDNYLFSGNVCHRLVVHFGHSLSVSGGLALLVYLQLLGIGSLLTSVCVA